MCSCSLPCPLPSQQHKKTSLTCAHSILNKGAGLPRPCTLKRGSSWMPPVFRGCGDKWKSTVSILRGVVPCPSRISSTWPWTTLPMSLVCRARTSPWISVGKELGALPGLWGAVFYLPLHISKSGLISGRLIRASLCGCCSRREPYGCPVSCWRCKAGP